LGNLAAWCSSGATIKLTLLPPPRSPGDEMTLPTRPPSIHPPGERRRELQAPPDAPARIRLRALLAELNASAGALAALTAAMQARLTGLALATAIHPHVHAVLDALDARELVDALPLAELPALLGELRTFAATHERLAGAVPASPGWAPLEPALLQAAGDASAGLAGHIQRSIAPALDGLMARLASPGASFLDVGAGAGVLSTQMALTWPLLHVVGVEPWPPAVARARANLREAGLDARVEIIEQSAEQLVDAARFDLAWVPSLFIPDGVLDLVLARVARALRPGGWALVASLEPHADRLVSSVARLRTSVWGGSSAPPEEMRDRLSACGFVEVLALSSAPTSVVVLLAARAPRDEPSVRERTVQAAHSTGERKNRAPT
jgi:SAM-dependent methyltransferase